MMACGWWGGNCYPGVIPARLAETENQANPLKLLEREKGFEPSTPTLARLCSTPELRPLVTLTPARVIAHPAEVRRAPSMVILGPARP